MSSAQVTKIDQPSPLGLAGNVDEIAVAVLAQVDRPDVAEVLVQRGPIGAQLTRSVECQSTSPGYDRNDENVM
jgi:hypothetical protein